MKIELITIGDTQVGKSSLLSKFADEKFNVDQITTIGIDFKIKYVKINDKKCEIAYVGHRRIGTVQDNDDVVL